MRVVERFATPVTEEPYNSVFASPPRRVEAKPDRACAVLLVRLIAGLQTLRDIRCKATSLHDSVNSACEHPTIGQPHAISGDCLDLFIRKTRAMPAYDFVGLQ